MKMVIGGAYQGKTDYAKQAYPNLVWSDGASCDLKDIFSCSGIVHFEEFVRRWIRENKAEHATDLAEQILQENPDLIVVTAEVGYGFGKNLYKSCSLCRPGRSGTVRDRDQDQVRRRTER